MCDPFTSNLALRVIISCALNWTLHMIAQIVFRISLLNCRFQILANHPENQFRNRADGYWFAYILQAGKSTQIKVECLTMDVTPLTV